MAGVGTVPLEAAATASAVLALGGDLEPDLVAQAARNAQARPRAATRPLARWPAGPLAMGVRPGRNHLRLAPPRLSTLPALSPPRRPQVSALALRPGPAPLLPLAAAAAALAEQGPPPPESAGGARRWPEMAIPAWHYEARCYARPPARAVGGGAHFAHWSAAELPLRSGVVDAVVVDLPFGQACARLGTCLRSLACAPLPAPPCLCHLWPGAHTMCSRYYASSYTI